MIRKDCPNCGHSSYSSGGYPWICPYCGTDLTAEPELPAERGDNNDR